MGIPENEAQKLLKMKRVGQVNILNHSFFRKLSDGKKSVKILQVLLAPCFVSICDLVIKNY